MAVTIEVVKDQWSHMNGWRWYVIENGMIRATGSTKTEASARDRAEEKAREMGFEVSGS